MDANQTIKHIKSMHKEVIVFKIKYLNKNIYVLYMSDTAPTEVPSSDVSSIVVEQTTSVDTAPTEVPSDVSSIVVEQASVDTVDTVPTEVPSSDVSFNVVELVEKTFIDIVQTSLTSLIIKDKLMKTQFNLTPELIEIVKKVLSSSPECFNDIEKAVNEIIKDGKIDSKDIPQFIIVVQKLYQIIYSLKEIKLDAKKRSEFTSTVLKYIVHLLIIERKIQIEEDKETQFLTDCDALIDACIGLLSFPKSIKTKGCLKKLFG